MLCSYGCNQEAKFQFKNGKWCCSKNHLSCLKTRENLSNIAKNRTGKLHPRFGKIHSKQSKEKISKSNKEFNKNNPAIWLGRKHSEETKKKISENGNRGKKIHSNEFKERQRQRLLNGDSTYMNKFIKNPSKQEVQLREIVKELYPNCEFQYPVLNYSLDVAIPEYKIAIEYDGWYHFDTEEHKKYHKLRQEKIENQSWKFVRYNIFQKFPSKEEIRNDIKQMFGEI